MLGVTVLELIVVLAVLVATSGLLVYNISPDSLRFGKGGQTTAHIVTGTTMQALRTGIVGDSKTPGYWDDMGHNPDLFPAMDRVRFLFSAPPIGSGLDGALDSAHAWMVKFDPARKLGWRGPYFQKSGSLFPTDGLNGFGAEYRPSDGTTYPTIVDGWGNPLVIQGPFASDTWSTAEVKRARIVSAGPNGILETSTQVDDYDSPATSDDIIVYIFE